jgi:hypothetical protein
LDAPFPPEGNRWLLLIHQLPKDPAYLRVKIGRQLAKVGAVPLKSSVYVLPRAEGTTEDFQWVRQQILAGGGEATLAEAALVDGLSDQEVEAKFREARDADYAEVVREARELSAAFRLRRGRGLSDERRAALLDRIGRLRQRIQEVSTTDFFGASLRETASGLLLELEQRATPAALDALPAPEPRARFRGRTWVTRTGIHVDRIASAWLIRKLIDPDASFKFVRPKGYSSLPEELRFDMYEAEYSHEGDRCTFETLVLRFELNEPGLRAVAEIVHDIDLKESKFGRPETSGVAACIAGLCRTPREDAERLAHGSVLFESLLSHFATRKPNAGG